ncbi:TPA: hypothetical protein ACYY2C_006281 [Pseudomonas aeruginosa]
MNSQALVTVTKGVERIVTVRQSCGSTAEIRQALAPRLSVVSLGVQGPVGVLAENVLQRALRAEADSREALRMAEANGAAMASLLADLSGAFTYHAGVISAQGG